MDKVISAQSYWEWFFNKHQDLEPFRSFISSDPILTKIFNFAAVPDIFSTIENNYPFDEKLAELSTTTKEDIAHLFDLNIRMGYSGDKQVEAEWLDFLDNLFKLVHTTLRYYENGKYQLNLDNRVLKENTIQSFKKRFSVCISGVSEGKKGKRYNWQRIGFALPDAELFIKEIPGTSPEVICEIHYLRMPTKEEVLSTKKKLGIGSIENFLRFRPMTDEICYGGFHTGLDQDPKSPSHLKKPESPGYLVGFFYKGKELKKGVFNYSIRKRYAGELYKAAGNKKNKERWDRLSYIETRLLEEITKYDRDKKAPGSFLWERIAWARGEYNKTLSTEEFDKEFYPEKDKDGNLKFPERKSRAELEHSSDTLEDLSEEDGYDHAINRATVESVLKKYCRDDTERAIIRALQNDASWTGTGTINLSEVARQLCTYKNEVRRRLDKILKRIKP